MGTLSYFTGAASILLALYGIFVEIIPYSSVLVMILFGLTVWLRKKQHLRSGNSVNSLQAQSNMNMNVWIVNALMTDRKARLHVFAAFSTAFAITAIFFYSGSSSILTDLPHEMTLVKTSGTLETVNVNRERRSPSYYVKLKMADGDGTTRRFGTFNIHQIRNGVEKFRSLQPGDQLDIIYRADLRDKSLPLRAEGRIMAVWANGQQILSLAESAAISASLKEDRKSMAIYCTVAAVCSIILAFLLGFRKETHLNPAKSGKQSGETSTR